MLAVLSHRWQKNRRAIVEGSPLFAVFFGLLLPLSAFAQVNALPGLIDGIAGSARLPTVILGGGLTCPMGTGTGACALANLLAYGIEKSRLLVDALATLVVVIAGFRLLIKQSDEDLQKAKRAIVACVVGIFLIHLVEPLVDAMYGGMTIGAGEIISNPSNTILGATIFKDELFGLLAWGETLVAILAVGLLVVQAVIVLTSFGKEETIRKAYSAVFYTIFGILLIVFDTVVAKIFGYDPSTVALPGAPTASLFIIESFGVVRLLLGLSGLVIVGIIIYAALLMIVNFGNDEILSRGRKILGNAAIGLMLIVVSFTIVNTVILGIA